ncbi:MAG: YcxB family protein [Prevotellaceae bacterium]|jgi:hypothetical protein|nr:YcxB family protein [Prevotellaceae bacterium]
MTDFIKVEYPVREKDLLETQLLIASQSKKLRRQRWTASVSATLILFVCILCRHPDDIKWIPAITISILAGGLLFFLIIPYTYRRHYLNQVKTCFAGMIGETVEVKITADSIETVDKTGETKIKLTTVKKVYETGNLFIFQSDSGLYLTIAKQDIDAVKFRDYLISHLQTGITRM